MLKKSLEELILKLLAIHKLKKLFNEIAFCCVSSKNDN